MGQVILRLLLRPLRYAAVCSPPVRHTRGSTPSIIAMQIFFFFFHAFACYSVTLFTLLCCRLPLFDKAVRDVASMPDCHYMLRRRLSPRSRYLPPPPLIFAYAMLFFYAIRRRLRAQHGVVFFR